jgi:hypothetical protein
MHATGANKRRPLYGPLGLVLALLLGGSAAWAERSIFGSSEQLELNEAQLADARREAEAQIPRLSPDTEARLQAANYPQLPPVSTAIDPSVDRANLSGTKPQGNSSGITPGLGIAGGFRQTPATPSNPDYAARYAQWVSEYQAASAAQRPRPPRTRTYLLSELTPTGRFGRKGKEGVYFRSAADKSEFLAETGTQFYDAELVGISPAGPVFRLKNGATRTVKYSAENVEPTTLQPSASPTPPDSAEKSPDE